MTGPRPGSDQGDDTALDNYNTTAMAPTITVSDPIGLDKRLFPDPGRTFFTIGDQVTYRLTLSLIEGTVNQVVVTDTLPDGLVFTDASVGLGNIGIATNFTAVSQAGQVLTFDFGQVRNPADGSTSDDFIAIDITARVANVAGNQNGTVLGNNASLSFQETGGTVVRDFDADTTTPGIQPLNITVGIPDLTLMKTAVPVQASLGDVVQYTVTLAHTLQSRGEAFDVVVADTLPAGLTYVPGSAVPPGIVSGQQLTWTVAALTRLQGRTSFTYQARVDLTAVVGVPLTNTAVAAWTTQPGADANERTGADGPGGLNDLVTQTTASVVPTESAFVDAAKTVSDLNGGSVLPGDTLEYTVVLRNQGGPVTGVVFTDPVPALTTYVPGSLSTTKGTGRRLARSAAHRAGGRPRRRRERLDLVPRHGGPGDRLGVRDLEPGQRGLRSDGPRADRRRRHRRQRRPAHRRGGGWPAEHRRARRTEAGRAADRRRRQRRRHGGRHAALHRDPRRRADHPHQRVPERHHSRRASRRWRTPEPSSAGRAARSRSAETRSARRWPCWQPAASPR